MKDFLKYMLASVLGVLIVMGIIFFISFGLLMGMMSLTEKQEVVLSDHTVIRIDLKDAVPERTAKDGLFGNPFSGSLKQVLGLNDILKNIKYATEDDKVDGIVMNLNVVPTGISTLEEIRDALIDFKAGGKFILCYGEYMTQPAYYLASVADEIHLHPQGFVDFKGLNAQLMFMKGMFDKLDIEMQVVRHGKFKSAVEPLIQEQMSPENREQYTVLVNSIWSSMLADIAGSRGLSEAELNTIADELRAYDAGGALAAGLIDGSSQRDEFRDRLSQHMDMDLEDITIISLSQYNRVLKNFSMTGDRLAVIYATGQIGGGKGDDNTVGSDRLAETIAKARKDDKVKAVVLRVNSPGGDALASDVIWREMSLLKKEKPVIVSMGDVAASGGYWISCASDKIIADPTTLTGSIGVFGVIPNFGEFFENKIGLTFDNVSTNANSGFPGMTRPLSAYERKVLEKKIEHIYSLFLDRVSGNRDLERDEVDEIGQGRVWSGVDAKRLGLVDELGGMDDAIKLAAEIAGLEEYRLLELPVQKDPLEQLLEELTAGVSTAMLKAELGVFYKDYRAARAALELEGVQALLPLSMTID